MDPSPLGGNHGCVAECGFGFALPIQPLPGVYLPVDVLLGGEGSKGIQQGNETIAQEEVLRAQNSAPPPDRSLLRPLKANPS